MSRLKDSQLSNKELDIFLREELKSGKRVSGKIDARIDDTLKMIQEQNSILIREKGYTAKGGKRKIYGAIAAAAALIISVSIWQSKAIVDAADKMYNYIYGEGRKEAVKESDNVYYSDTEINLGGERGTIKFVYWYNNKLLFVRQADFQEGASVLFADDEHFRYSYEETDIMGQDSVVIFKEVYYTDEEAGNELFINVDGKEYHIGLEKQALHQAGETHNSISLGIYDITLFPLGNQGKAYYIDRRIDDRYSGYDITNKVGFYSKEGEIGQHQYIQCDDIIYFNDENVSFDRMDIATILKLDFVKKLGYENCPRIELPVPADQERVEIKKDFYIGTIDDKAYSLYIDSVYRTGDGLYICYGKDSFAEVKEFQDNISIDIDSDNPYWDLVKSRDNYLKRDGEYYKMYQRYENGTLEELYQNGTPLPVVCWNVSITLYDEVEVN